MIAGGVDATKLTEVKQNLCVDRNVDATINCTAAVDKVNNPKTNLDEYIFNAVGKLCFCDVKNQIDQSAAQCVVSLLNNPSSYSHKKTSWNTTGSSGGKRELDLSEAASKLGTAVSESTTIADLFQRAQGSGGDTGGGAAAGAVPSVGNTEYDSDGYRVRDPFVPSVPQQSTTDAKVTGGLQLDIQRGQDPEGKDYSELLYAPSLNVVIPLVKKEEWTMDVEVGGALATLGTVAKGEPAALVKGAHPRFPITADFHGDILVKIPLDRNNSVVVPEINLIQKNSAASKLEETIRNRWGWSRLENEKENSEKWGDQAAEIYLNSVLRPTMANNAKEFDVAWQAVVATGTKRYEEFLGGKFPAADEANLWADLFKYDPMGLVDAVALWTGKKSAEVKKDLEGRVNLTAFQENKVAERVNNFKSVLEAVKTLGYTQAYRLPSDYTGQSNPAEEKKPDTYDRKEGYALALEEHKGAVAGAVGMKGSELDQVAADAKIPNPFESRSNDPGNVWAAQKIWNDYVTALFKKKVPDGKKGESPKWYLIIKGGWQDYGSDNPGPGVSGGVEWAPKEGTSVSVLVYGGFSRGNWIEVDPDTKPSIATDGGALGVSANATHVFYKSKDGFWRSVSAKAGFSYATAGSEPEPAGNIQDVLTVPGLGVDTTLHLGVDIDVGASVAYRQRWPLEGPANFRKIGEAHLVAHLTEQTSVKLTGIGRLGAIAGDYEERSADQPFSRRGQKSGLSSVVVGEDIYSLQALLLHKFNETFTGFAGGTFVRQRSTYTGVFEDIWLFTLGGSLP